MMTVIKTVIGHRNLLELSYHGRFDSCFVLGLGLGARYRFILDAARTDHPDCLLEWGLLLVTCWGVLWRACIPLGMMSWHCWMCSGNHDCLSLLITFLPMSATFTAV